MSISFNPDWIDELNNIADRLNLPVTTGRTIVNKYGTTRKVSDTRNVTIYPPKTKDGDVGISISECDIEGTITIKNVTVSGNWSSHTSDTRQCVIGRNHQLTITDGNVTTVVQQDMLSEDIDVYELICIIKAYDICCNSVIIDTLYDYLMRDTSPNPTTTLNLN